MTLRLNKNGVTNLQPAFTMAEILLSLTIIGVVAAITLPSLTGNINERTWNTQRKALYARFSQAMALMPSLNGYGTLTAGDSSTSAVDTAAETFITEGLSKVLKINNICDHEHLADCGIPTKITPMSGSLIELSDISTIKGLNSLLISEAGYPLDINAAAFETQNGESILVYYNPKCRSNQNITSWHFIGPYLCANFIYDLNGKKGPNTMGKDIGFITALYPTDPVIVAPLPLTTNAERATQKAAGQKCVKQDTDSRLPNKEELSAIFYNKKLTGMDSAYWSSSIVSTGSSGRGWVILFYHGHLNPYLSSDNVNVRCIKR